MTVLIVDDEPYMVDYMKTIVDWESYGFDTVKTAGGGSLAKELLTKYEPELLITDIKMPKISGIDLSAFIEEEQYTTKVIIISGYSDFEYAKQAVRYGVFEYMVKPVLKADFEETLERILGKCFEADIGNEMTDSNCLRDKNAVVAYVKKYVCENCEDDLSLEILGGIVHLHPAYLSKIFKEVSDMNLSGYITEIKMQRAAELLEQTDRKVQDVMKQLGYQKSQHFSKLFKEKYGVTPKEYRRNKRQF